MIEVFTAKGFRVLRDVTVRLTRLHAFIGPNDSGKTTLLEALRALHRGECPTGATLGAELGDGLSVQLSGDIITLNPGSGKPTKLGTGQLADFRGRLAENPPGDPRRAELEQILRELGGARLLNLDQHALSRPSQLVPDDQPLTLGERGANLPGVLDALLNRGDETFARLSETLRRLFPVVARLRLRTTSSTQKAIAVQLVDGTEVGGGELSAGILHSLAFMVLEYLQPVSALLLEEPESGLHPSRIREIMSLLRRLSQAPGGPQVILATHSPQVINELGPDEISVVTRGAETGTRVTRLLDVQIAGPRSRLEAAWDLWSTTETVFLDRSLLPSGGSGTAQR